LKVKVQQQYDRLKTETRYNRSHSQGRIAITAIVTTFRKISKIGATRCQILRLIIRFQLGLRTDTAGGASALLRLPTGFQEFYF